MRHATILVAILAFVPLASATAQEAPPVKVGDRVRVTAPDLGLYKQAGRLEALRADTLVVAVADSTMTFPVASVTRLELSRGQKSHGLAGALIGGLVGAASGAILGYADGDDPPCRESGWFACWGETRLTAKEKARAGAIVLGIVGVVVGRIVGANTKTDKWEEVPVDRVRVSLGPQRDGRFGFGASVRF